jgi:HKD family nuclease
MIHTSTGHDVVRMLDRVARTPARYSDVVVCCPFIGDDLMPRLLSLLERANATRCTIRVVTSHESANALIGRLSTKHVMCRRYVIGRTRLHAKVYLAIARRHVDSEAIVTSANLTRGGTVDNIELGVRAVPSCDAGRRLLDDIHHFVRRLAA